MNKFEITSIRCRKYEKQRENGVVGTASIIIDNSFLINDIKIVNTNGKMFCGMPSRLDKNNEFIDICNPINNATRRYLENLILAEYLNTVGDEVKNEV